MDVVRVVPRCPLGQLPGGRTGGVVIGGAEDSSKRHEHAGHMATFLDMLTLGGARQPTLLRRAAVIGAVAALTFAGGGATAQAATVPPCINYSHAEEGGHIEIDLRFDPKTKRNTTLTIFLFVNDPAGAPGTYTWTNILNGKPWGSPHFELKDNNLHTVFRQEEGWVFGDHYRFQATHYSPATRTTYIAAYNECVITPR